MFQMESGSTTDVRMSTSQLEKYGENLWLFLLLVALLLCAIAVPSYRLLRYDHIDCIATKGGDITLLGILVVVLLFLSSRLTPGFFRGGSRSNIRGPTESPNTSHHCGVRQTLICFNRK